MGREQEDEGSSMKTRIRHGRWWVYLGFSIVVAACGSGLALNGQKVSNAVSQGVALLYANIHHDLVTAASDQMTLAQELAEASSLPNTTYPNYRDIPKILTDDDGACSTTEPYYSSGVGCVDSDSIVQFVNHSLLTKCGYSQSTVAERIADCQNVNHANATWVGATAGNAGQNSWQLVTKTDVNGFEVWQDMKTSLLWSDAWSTNTAGTTNQTNWCRAAGNAETTDPSGYCSPSYTGGCYVNGTYVPSASCQLATPESDCAEQASVALPTAVPSTVAPGQSQAFYEEKGYMLKAPLPAHPAAPSVLWRLPTKYDWQQADNDGIRFVVPNMVNSGGENAFWSASVVSYFRNNAWYFNGGIGYVYNYYRSSAYAVRCVGR